MAETYRKRVTISASIGTKWTLKTLDGWHADSDEDVARGVFTVTDPDWRDDVARAGDAKVLSVE